MADRSEVTWSVLSRQLFGARPGLRRRVRVCETRYLIMGRVAPFGRDWGRLYCPDSLCCFIFLMLTENECYFVVCFLLLRHQKLEGEKKKFVFMEQ